MTVSTLTVVPGTSVPGAAPSAEPTRSPRRPRLLDLFCGAGGASAGYHTAGFDVLGVDIAPQPDYPFPFHRADALDVLADPGWLAGFDVVHASPPCQAYSHATPAARRADHPDLIGPVRDLLTTAVATVDGPWGYVIENVPGAPLHNPVTICGDSLRLGVRRHRLFESNLPLAGTGCWHDRPALPVAVYGTYNQRTRRRTRTATASTDAARAAMGIDWMPWPALTQAIPPAYTHWLAVQLLVHHHIRVVTQPDRRSELGACVTPVDVLEGEASPGDQEACVTDAAGQPSPRRPGSVTAAGALRHCRCGRPLPPRPATGRWPRYCCHACRQAAYRLRIADRSGGRT